MKWIGLLSTLLTVPAVSAAPALVWQKSSGAAAALPVHTSEDIGESGLFRAPEQSSLQVVFVIGRKEDGTETLSSWTAAGSLPGVAELAPEALAIHHSVSVQSAVSLTQTAKSTDKTAIQVGLEELKHKIEHPATEEVQVGADGQTKKMAKRALALETATTLIVEVPAHTDPAVLDEAVVDSVEREFTVVLTAVRSVQEVKMERSRMAQERMARMTEAARPLTNRRRLEDMQYNGQQQQQYNGQQQQYNGQQQQQYNRQGQQDVGSVYYVSMTPNIMAGLLFFFLFAFIALIGVSCMGMIAGQDVYVKKMPSIGREA